jgi:hypothetical protein
MLKYVAVQSSMAKRSVVELWLCSVGELSGKRQRAITLDNFWNWVGRFSALFGFVVAII